MEYAIRVLKRELKEINNKIEECMVVGSGIDLRSDVTAWVDFKCQLEQTIQFLEGVMECRVGLIT